MEQWCIWLIIIIIMAIIEAGTVKLTTIWFVASGIVTLVVSFFTDSYFIQFGIFVLLGAILLAITKIVSRLRMTGTTDDRILSMPGLVTVAIAKNKNGEVKVDGKKWIAYADKTIEVGSLVKILKINGEKLKVEKKD